MYIGDEWNCFPCRLSLICLLLQRAGKRYGLAQKFKRLRIIHQLLWYHVYGYEGTVPEGLSDSVNATSKSYLGFPRGHVDVKSSKKGKGKGKGSHRTSAGQGTECPVTSTPVGQGDSQGSEMYADSDTDDRSQTSKEKEFSPPVYLDEMTWRRFLPPLPKHSGEDPPKRKTRISFTKEQHLFNTVQTSK